MTKQLELDKTIDQVLIVLVGITITVNIYYVDMHCVRCKMHCIYSIV